MARNTIILVMNQTPEEPMGIEQEIRLKAKRLTQSAKEKPIKVFFIMRFFQG